MVEFKYDYIDKLRSSKLTVPWTTLLYLLTIRINIFSILTSSLRDILSDNIESSKLVNDPVDTISKSYYIGLCYFCGLEGLLKKNFISLLTLFGFQLKVTTPNTIEMWLSIFLYLGSPGDAWRILICNKLLERSELEGLNRYWI